MPAPEVPTTHPSRDASDASDELDAADRADRRRLLWGILLMLALTRTNDLDEIKRMFAEY